MRKQSDITDAYDFFLLENGRNVQLTQLPENENIKRQNSITFQNRNKRAHCTMVKHYSHDLIT